MSQSAFDGLNGPVGDRIEAAAARYSEERGPISDIGDFAFFCLTEGYLSDLDLNRLRLLGAVEVIKREFKSEDNGLRKWICTGEGKDKEWVSRRLCTSDQHIAFCRLLKKKRDDINAQLCLELQWREDRGWDCAGIE